MRRSRESGLTLVELMAGLAISALVAMAALALATALPRSEAAGKLAQERIYPASAWPTLLGVDVAHAKRFRAVDGGFELGVHSGLDGRTLEVRHLEAVVTWKVETIAGTNWLVRTQETPGGKMLAEVVARGVRSIEAAPGTGNTSDEGDGWRGMPEALCVKTAPEGEGSVAAVFTFGLE